MEFSHIIIHGSLKASMEARIDADLHVQYLPFKNAIHLQYLVFYWLKIGLFSQKTSFIIKEPFFKVIIGQNKKLSYISDHPIFFFFKKVFYQMH